jgi:methyl-accepting chemotaxis protein
MKKKLKSVAPTTLSTATVIETPVVKPAMPKKTNGRSKANAELPKQNPRLNEPHGTENAHLAANGNGKRAVAEYSDELDLRELLKVLTDVKDGNFSVRLPEDKLGLSGKICDVVNHIVSLNEMLMEELGQAKDTIGKKGHLNHRVSLPRSAKGSWAAGVDSINTLISDLVTPTIEIAHVISSVAKGNLSQDMPLRIGDHQLQGEFAKIASEVNDMVKQLNLFSMEVTRVAREVGSEGKLGGQAKVVYGKT